MQFTIPNSFTGTGAVTFKIDRSPTLSSEIRTHSFKDSMGFPFEQSRPDGIHTTKTTTSFTIQNQTSTNVTLIDSYFESLTAAIDVVYPDETKQVFITGWTITKKHYLYSDIVVQGRIVT